MRRHIKAIARRQQDSTLGGRLAERTSISSTHQPRERSHTTFWRNPTEHIAMVRHETLEKLEVPGCGFLSFAEHGFTFTDRDFRKDFSRRAVAYREVGACGPVLLATLSIVLDHPSRAHARNRKRFG